MMSLSVFLLWSVLTGCASATIIEQHCKIDKDGRESNFLLRGTEFRVTFSGSSISSVLKLQVKLGEKEFSCVNGDWAAWCRGVKEAGYTFVGNFKVVLYFNATEEWHWATPQCGVLLHEGGHWIRTYFDNKFTYVVVKPSLYIWLQYPEKQVKEPTILRDGVIYYRESHYGPPDIICGTEQEVRPAPSVCITMPTWRRELPFTCTSTQRLTKDDFKDAMQDPSKATLTRYQSPLQTYQHSRKAISSRKFNISCTAENNILEGATTVVKAIIAKMNHSMPVMASTPTPDSHGTSYYPANINLTVICATSNTIPRPELYWTVSHDIRHTSTPETCQPSYAYRNYLLERCITKLQLSFADIPLDTPNVTVSCRSNTFQALTSFRNPEPIKYSLLFLEYDPASEVTVSVIQDSEEAIRLVCPIVGNPHIQYEWFRVIDEMHGTRERFRTLTTGRDVLAAVSGATTVFCQGTNAMMKHTVLEARITVTFVSSQGTWIVPTLGTAGAILILGIMVSLFCVHKRYKSSEAVPVT